MDDSWAGFTGPAGMRMLQDRGGSQCRCPGHRGAAWWVPACHCILKIQVSVLGQLTDFSPSGENTHKVYFQTHLVTHVFLSPPITAFPLPPSQTFLLQALLSPPLPLPTTRAEITFHSLGCSYVPRTVAVWC